MPLAGEYVRASHVTDLFVRKTASESVLNSTTLQDDDHFTFSVEANSIYEIMGMLLYDGSTTGDLKLTFSAPASSSLNIVWNVNASTSVTSNSAPGTGNFTPGNPTFTFGCVGVGTSQGASLLGMLVTSATAGTLKLTWAQGTLDAANATRILQESYMRLRKMDD